MSDLYVIVWRRCSDGSVIRAIPPLDENPGSDDQGMMVYRSRAAGELAAQYQNDQYGGSSDVAECMPLIEFMQSI